MGVTLAIRLRQGDQPTPRPISRPLVKSRLTVGFDSAAAQKRQGNPLIEINLNCFIRFDEIQRFSAFSILPTDVIAAGLIQFQTMQIAGIFGIGSGRLIECTA